uniref:Putative secreted protein n=1 Tax=Anopheles triannulatus TaxID=58253 RepID=A0A2M4B7T7_9DIPT
MADCWLAAGMLAYVCFHYAAASYHATDKQQQTYNPSTSSSAQSDLLLPFCSLIYRDKTPFPLQFAGLAF